MDLHQSNTSRKNCHFNKKVTKKRQSNQSNQAVSIYNYLGEIFLKASRVRKSLVTLVTLMKNTDKALFYKGFAVTKRVVTFKKFWLPLVTFQ